MKTTKIEILTRKIRRARATRKNSSTAFAGKVRSSLSLLVILTLSFGAAFLPSRSHALTEDSLTTPTASWFYSGVTMSNLNDRINKDNARIIDLEIEGTNPFRFSANLIHNSGSHQKGWSWLVNVTASALGQHLSNTNSRIIDLERIPGSGTRYAAVMVANTGAEGKGWWWLLNRTPQQVSEFLQTNSARIVDLDAHTDNGTTRYDIVAISNTGSDQRSWWFWWNESGSSINAKLQQHKARLVDIERNASGKFAAVMVANPEGKSTWWTYGKSLQQLGNQAQQLGMRVIDIESYLALSGFSLQRRYVAVLIDNVNPVTSSIRDSYLSTATLPGNEMPDGQWGFYMKEVGGPVHVALNHTRQFEPASTIKVLPHLFAMSAVQNDPNWDLNQPIMRLANPGGNKDICPENLMLGGTEMLSTALRRMMENSDNPRTRQVIDTFGQGNINNFAANTVGMSGTVINHVLGCGWSNILNANRTTLADLGMLYEGVADGSLLSGTARDSFQDLMANGSPYKDVIREEAADLLNTSVADSAVLELQKDFSAHVQQYVKGGSYDLCWGTCTPYNYFRSSFRAVTLPFKVGSSLQIRDYVLGGYVDSVVAEGCTPGMPCSETTGFATASSMAISEMMRAPIRAALESWLADEPSESEQCSPPSSSQLKVVKLHKEGAQKVIFKSRVVLEDADEFFMKPGAYFEIQDRNGDTLWEHDASDPALESWEFWKSNFSTTAKLIIKNADGGKLKVLVKRKRKGDANEVEVKIIATRLDLPVAITDLPLTLKMDAKRRFGFDASDVHEYGCSKTDFSPEAGGICASNSSATMVMCRD